MILIYAREPIPTYTDLPMIFLAGPTPRLRKARPWSWSFANVLTILTELPAILVSLLPWLRTRSWRPAAIKCLRAANYQGIVLIPEDRDGGCENGAAQIEWEDTGLTRANVIIFWVPRNLRTMPGLTTNIEWGRWERSGKVVFGAPPEAERVGYILHYCQEFGIPATRDLRLTIQSAMTMLRSSHSIVKK